MLIITMVLLISLVPISANELINYDFVLDDKAGVIEDWVRDSISDQIGRYKRELGNNFPNSVYVYTDYGYEGDTDVLRDQVLAEYSILNRNDLVIVIFPEKEKYHLIYHPEMDYLYGDIDNSTVRGRISRIEDDKSFSSEVAHIIGTDVFTLLRGQIEGGDPLDTKPLDYVALTQEKEAQKIAAIKKVSLFFVAIVSILLLLEAIYSIVNKKKSLFSKLIKNTWFFISVAFKISLTRYKNVPKELKWLKILTLIIQAILVFIVIFISFAIIYGIVIGSMLIGSLLGSTEDAMRKQTDYNMGKRNWYYYD